MIKTVEKKDSNIYINIKYMFVKVYFLSIYESKKRMILPSSYIKNNKFKFIKEYLIKDNIISIYYHLPTYIYLFKSIIGTKRTLS